MRDSGPATAGCNVCGAKAAEVLLDFGPQPLCNRYLSKASEDEYSRPLRLGQCGACGVVELIDPPPPGEMSPRHGWIAYRDPDAHLDVLAGTLAALPGLAKRSRLCAIGPASESLLAKMRERGFERTKFIEPKADLGLTDARHCNGAVLERFDAAAVKAVAAGGKADLVIALHIVEHAHDLGRFLGALRELMNPGGHLVVEVPDCRRAMEEFDYSALWEEHVLYFTPETFRRALLPGGFELIHFQGFPYALEDSLVAVVCRREEPGDAGPPASILREEVERARRFAQGLAARRDAARRSLRESPAALFGAGHRSCVFINLLGLREGLDFVVDDDPNKKGLFMPGSRLPILGSAALMERGVKLCLLGVSPESEEKVMRKNQAFLAGGGRFLSIYPGSKAPLPS